MIIIILIMIPVPLLPHYHPPNHHRCRHFIHWSMLFGLDLWGFFLHWGRLVPSTLCGPGTVFDIFDLLYCIYFGRAGPKPASLTQLCTHLRDYFSWYSSCKKRMCFRGIISCCQIGRPLSIPPSYSIHTTDPPPLLETEVHIFLSIIVWVEVDSSPLIQLRDSPFMKPYENVSVNCLRRTICCCCCCYFISGMRGVTVLYNSQCTSTSHKFSPLNLKQQ